MSHLAHHAGLTRADDLLREAAGWRRGNALLIDTPPRRATLKATLYRLGAIVRTQRPGRALRV